MYRLNLTIIGRVLFIVADMKDKHFLIFKDARANSSIFPVLLPKYDHLSTKFTNFFLKLLNNYLRH